MNISRKYKAINNTIKNEERAAVNIVVNKLLQQERLEKQRQKKNFYILYSQTLLYPFCNHLYCSKILSDKAAEKRNSSGAKNIREFKTKKAVGWVLLMKLLNLRKPIVRFF